MRFRGLLVAVVVLAALGGGIYWSNKVKEAEADKPDPNAPPKILSIPEDQFQQIEILKNSDEPTVLRKADSGDWEMLGPKQWTVDQDAAGSLVSTLSSLDSGRLVEEKVSDLAPFGLESPAMEVTITKNNGEVQNLLIGEESPAGGGYFAKLQNDPRVFTVASFNKTSLDKSPGDLRDKRLLTFDSEKLTRVELLAKGQLIEFGKNAQNDWQIIRPKPLRADGGQVEELIRRLKDAKMDASAAEEGDKKAPSAFRSGKRVAIAKVTDVSGTQQLEVRKDKDSNYYARSNAVEGTHKITSNVGEELDKSLADFRNKKLFDFGWSDPSKIEVRDGDRQATYEKSDDKWMAGSKQMDSTTVQDLVSKLRDLSAIEFVDKGYTTPFFEATVTSDEGKRVEKVSLSKQDERYFGKRENEPSIYELEGSAVDELQKAAGEVKEHQPSEDEEKK
jgi:hypothetical protein